MQLSLLLVQKIAAMFLMMLCGFVVVRFKLLKAEDSRILAVICMYVLTPCVLIDAFQIECTADRLNDFLAMILAAVLAHAVFILATLPLKKALKLSRVEQLSLIYSNAGNLILPLVLAVFGEEMVFFACPYMCVQTILVWTHGRTILAQEGKADLKKIFLNINVLCTLLGLIFFIGKIRLPSMIADTCASLGGTIGPVSMVFTGMLIGGADLKKIFSQGRSYLICILRLIIYPLILIFALKFTGITRLTSSPAVPMITLLAASAPSAATVTNLAQVYRRDPETAAAINILTMVLCIATIPLLNLLYQIIIL